MKKLKRINPLRTAISVALVFAILGLIFGILGLIVSDLSQVNISQSFVKGFLEEGGQVSPTMNVLSALIFAPAIEFLLMFISVIVLVMIYNFVAKRYPVEFDLK